MHLLQDSKTKKKSWIDTREYLTFQPKRNVLGERFFPVFDRIQKALFILNSQNLDSEQLSFSELHICFEMTMPQVQRRKRL